MRNACRKAKMIESDLGMERIVWTPIGARNSQGELRGNNGDEPQTEEEAIEAALITWGRSDTYTIHRCIETKAIRAISLGNHSATIRYITPEEVWRITKNDDKEDWVWWEPSPFPRELEQLKGQLLGPKTKKEHSMQLALLISDIIKRKMNKADNQGRIKITASNKRREGPGGD